MSLDISSESIFARFDRLTDQGIIHFGPSKVVSLVDEGFPFEFRICPSWSKKPLTVSGKTESQDTAKKFGPGSDINLSHPNQVIGIIKSTHVLALNIYPVFRPQYLLLTLDSYRKQNEVLDLHDLAASLEFLNMDGGEDYYVMYNCAEESGCSRNHKHVQIVPKPKPNFTFLQGGFQFFPDIEEHETTINVPYIYFLQYFGRNLSTLEIWDMYRELLKKCRRSLGMNEDNEKMVCPHNVVLTANWMLLIPRRNRDV